MTFFDLSKTSIVTLSVVMSLIGLTVRAQTPAVINMMNLGNSVPQPNLTNKTVKPFVWPNSVSYTDRKPAPRYKSTSFKVERDLNLTVTRHYSFTINISRDDFRGTSQTLNDGWYLMNMALILPNPEVPARGKIGLGAKLPPEDLYIASVSRLVRYSNGAIQTDVDMEFDNMTVLALESQLYIQLAPVIQESLEILPSGYVNVYNTTVAIADSSATPLVVSIPFTPIKDNDSRHISTPDNGNRTDVLIENLQKYTNDAQLIRANARPQPMDESTFATKNKLFLLNADDITFPEHAAAFDRQLFNNLFEITNGAVQPLPDNLSPAITNALCAKLFAVQPGRAYRGIYQSGDYLRMEGCRRDPDKYLRFSKTIHAKAVVTGNSFGVEEVPLHYNVLSNFSISLSDSTDTTMSLGASVNSVSLLSAFGKNADFTVANISVSANVSQNQNFSVGHSGTGQTITSLTVTPIEAQIPLATYRTCLMVEANTAALQTRLKFNGLYICQPMRTGLNFTEHFYLALQDVNGKTDVSNQAVNVLMRSERDINEFFSAIDQFVNPIKNDPISVGDVFKNSKQIYARLQHMAPGVFVMPMAKASDIQSRRAPPPIPSPSILKRIGAFFSGKPADQQ
jgi:hypothetical protein